eukprot:jgi/Ulvmu1/9383/UM051_0010.1
MAHVTATVDTFAAELAKLRKQAHKYPVFVVWTAGAKDDKSPPTTWCPDCNRCVPAAREAAKEAGAYLLEVSVGPSAEYKSEDLFLRAAPEYADHFSGIPLLAVYVNGKLKDTTKTELEAAPSHEAAVAVAEAFITKYNVTCTALKCPMVMTGVAVGVAVLAAGAVFIYSQRRASK